MLDLSRVTLLFVETRAHKVTKRVIDDCIARVNFGDILIFTDKPDLIPIPGARYIAVPDFPNKVEAGRFYYSKAMAHVETDFALMLEWDAGIFDETKWLPEFFSYDYIGAPWPYTISRGRFDVGNGGFTLMSKKLGHFICQHAQDFPCVTDMDVCKKYREQYENAGFVWPNSDLASCFAWELGERNPNHFGYHGAFTWPDLLPMEEVVERAKLMLESNYLTHKLAGVFKVAPWLTAALGPDLMTKYFLVVPPGRMLRPNIPGATSGMSSQQRAASMLMQAQRRAVVIGKSPSKGLKA